jgi:hypothetical protein
LKIYKKMVKVILIALLSSLAIVIIVLLAVIGHWVIGNGDIDREIKAKRYKIK